MTQPKEPFLNMKQLCDRLADYRHGRPSPSSIEKAIEKDGFPFCLDPFTDRYFFIWSDVEKWLSRRVHSRHEEPLIHKPEMTD